MNYAGDETVSRFRPLARRRFRTSRPFFVLMRTRKPCVRRRRRRFGWNVRFMIADPLSPEESGGETSIVAKALPECQSWSPDPGRRLRRERSSLRNLRRPSLSRHRPCANVASPAAPPVGSPPEVFHNCGKKCGKAIVFAPPLSHPACLGTRIHAAKGEKQAGNAVIKRPRSS